ncbi:hypothetical protein FGG08_001344 [Glutinoglossum americanum]|uniref:Srp40 C-terminal domain-containing protein n=1 Tax=Glutinoglossum americanum TaxID=1670608 RepID=A0A9P8L6B8_9PEZI|nr:hypothetical protein FGG08_001344 [Glutinoglossum americanum]
MKRSKLPHPPPELLSLISRYLTNHGFTNTVNTLSKDRQRHSRLNKWEDDKTIRKGADLGNIYNEWDGRQRQSVTEAKKAKMKAEAPAEKSVSDSDEEPPPPSSCSSEDSDADDESELGGQSSALRKLKPGLLKRKAHPTDSSGSSSSTSSSSSSSSTSSSSSSEDRPHKSKKAKLDTAVKTKKKKKKKSSSDSKSDSSSDSDSKSSSGSSSHSGSESDSSSSTSGSSSDSSDSSSSTSSGSDDSAQGVALPSSGESSSGSSSDSDSSSGSNPPGSSKENQTPSHKKDVAKQSPSKDNKAKKPGSDSSETLEGDKSPISSLFNKKILAISTPNTNMERKRSPSYSITPATTTSGTNTPDGKRLKAISQKSQNTPFSRIGSDVKVDPRLASNAYIPYEYAERAHRDLIVTKGKGFTKEKNKKKRGSYRGGPIDTGAVKSFRFED